MRKQITKIGASLLAAGMLITGCASSGSAGKESTAANKETSASQQESKETSGQSKEAETTAVASQPETESIPEETEEELWIPAEPAPIRNAANPDTIWKDELELLSAGTLLFEGEENKGFYPGTDDLGWLYSAAGDDMLGIIYSCDDITHGGWGVLGLKVGKNQDDISAYADEPDKQRLITYSIDDLLDIAGTESAEGLEFALGAWNGGHIHGLYYLDGEKASALKEYIKKTEDDSKIIHTYTGKLSNENAIPEAVKVYDYLKEVWDNEEGCITGQMESTWKGSADYEVNFIFENSGKYPAIRGLDFMHNDFTGVTERAKKWWEKGGIVTICWHTGSDFNSAYNESKSSELDWENALTPGTDAYAKLLKDMDRAVPYLQQLEDAGVPVLWRPFHELDGGWFWWSRGGSENFVKLWQLMYSRYTDYWGLDNLIWVLGYSHNGVDLGDWYPGDDYVDLIGGDSYDRGANKSLFEDVKEVAADGMPIVFHECGTIPTEKQMEDADSPWLFFMVWHTDYITDEKNNTKESINEIYNSDYFITLDELPAFK